MARFAYRRLLPLGLVCVLTPAVAQDAPPAPGADSRPAALFAIAIGHNPIGDKEGEALKYADDDAVRNARLMALLGAESILLTDLDRDSATLYPQLQPHPPTKERLERALSTFNDRMLAAQANGRQAVLYLFYSGHGDVDQGEGYVQLRGSRLTRSDLLSLLRRSRADINHVVIDACKSYFVVFRRGGQGRRRAVRGQILPPEQPVPANTGLLLSTSSAEDSHEWEGFQAGVFSHEVRSAVRGAADLDRDGIVTYEEAGAFIFNANRSVPNRRFRPRFVARPHRKQQLGKAALVDLRAIAARRIVFGPRLAGHHYVEDRWGTRLADLHPAGTAVTVLFQPTGKLFVRVPATRHEYAVPDGAQINLTEREASASTSRARGAEHESFRRLFAEPFDRAALESYRVDIAGRPRADRPTRPALSWVRPAVGVVALVGLATGVTFSVLAATRRADVGDETSNEDRQQVNRTIKRDNTAAAVAYAVGGAAALGYLAWTFWPRPAVQVRVSSGFLPDVGAGARLGVTW